MSHLQHRNNNNINNNNKTHQVCERKRFLMNFLACSACVSVCVLSVLVARWRFNRRKASQERTRLWASVRINSTSAYCEAQKQPLVDISFRWHLFACCTVRELELRNANSTHASNSDHKCHQALSRTMNCTLYKQEHINVYLLDAI